MAPAETNERRERRDAQRNLKRVLQAAHELFAERGADVTMEEVARRAGVGVGTIYRRFPSKDQLFAAVSSAVCSEAQSRLQSATQAACDPLSKLRALVFVQYHRCAGAAALLDAAPAAAQAGAPPFEHELYRALQAMLEQLIGDAQRAGVVRQGEPAVLAALCLELLSPHALQHLLRAANGSAEDAADHVVRFVLGGLGAT